MRRYAITIQRPLEARISRLDNWAPLIKLVLLLITVSRHFAVHPGVCPLWWQTRRLFLERSSFSNSDFEPESKLSLDGFDKFECRFPSPTSLLQQRVFKKCFDQYMPDGLSLLESGPLESDSSGSIHVSTVCIGPLKAKAVPKLFCFIAVYFLPLNNSWKRSRMCLKSKTSLMSCRRLYRYRKICFKSVQCSLKNHYVAGPTLHAWQGCTWLINYSFGSCNAACVVILPGTFWAWSTVSLEPSPSLQIICTNCYFALPRFCLVVPDHSQTRYQYIDCCVIP